MLVAEVPNPHPLPLALNDIKYFPSSDIVHVLGYPFCTADFLSRDCSRHKKYIVELGSAQIRRTSLWFDKATLRLRFFEQRHQARTSCPAMCTILLHWREYVL